MDIETSVECKREPTLLTTLLVDGNRGLGAAPNELEHVLSSEMKSSAPMVCFSSSTFRARLLAGTSGQSVQSAIL